MLRNECKEGNIKNLNRGDPFKKLQKIRGFFVTEKTFRKRKIHIFRKISRNECIRMRSSSSEQQLKVTLIIFNSWPQ